MIYFRCAVPDEVARVWFGLEMREFARKKGWQVTPLDRAYARFLCGTAAVLWGAPQ